MTTPPLTIMFSLLLDYRLLFHNCTPFLSSECQPFFPSSIAHDPAIRTACFDEAVVERVGQILELADGDRRVVGVGRRELPDDRREVGSGAAGQFALELRIRLDGNVLELPLVDGCVIVGHGPRPQNAPFQPPRGISPGQKQRK